MDEAFVWTTDSNAVQGTVDHFKLTDRLSGCVQKFKASGHRRRAAEITVSSKLDGIIQDGVIEWTGLRQLDHDPFRSFAGSDEIKLALAAKIIQAHGGSGKFIDKKFVIRLQLPALHTELRSEIENK